MNVVQLPGVRDDEWPTPEEFATSPSARAQVRAELRHFLLMLARVICPECPEGDVPTLGELAAWWPRASKRSRDAADAALAALLGRAWSWRVTEHPMFDPDEPVFVAFPDRSVQSELRSTMLTVVHVHREFEHSDILYDDHPMVPIVRAWLYERAVPGVVFRPKTRASLPRLGNGAHGERASGMLLSDAPPSGKRARVLPFGGRGPEICDSCPSWLLEMYVQSARGGRGGAKGLAWSFRLVVAGLVHLGTAQRDGRTRDLDVTVEDLIDWLELARAGGSLDASLAGLSSSGGGS